MSYGPIGKQATKYREMQVLAASPSELVILVYDHLIVQLLRAQQAQGTPNLEVRSAALEKARAAMCELLVTLDRDKGGAIAAQLASIYSFLLGEMSTLGVRPEPKRFERVLRIVRELREAFAKVAEPAAPTAHAVLA